MVADSATPFGNGSAANVTRVYLCQKVGALFFGPKICDSVPNIRSLGPHRLATSFHAEGVDTSAFSGTVRWNAGDPEDAEIVRVRIALQLLLARSPGLATPLVDQAGANVGSAGHFRDDSALLFDLRKNPSPILSARSSPPLLDFQPQPRDQRVGAAGAVAWA